MKYSNVITGKFIKRLNRFLAEVEIDGLPVLCHVKNTGRLKELLTEATTVFLQSHADSSAKRKTLFSLIGVKKGETHINIDSQAPNKVMKEALEGGLILPDADEKAENIKSEVFYKNSRFDLAFTLNGRQTYMEIKGVTLNKNGVALFPDAPTERGVKHINELADAVCNNNEAYIVFIIQRSDAYSLSPNRETHKEFAEALLRAQKNGVKILAYSCHATPDSLSLSSPVPVIL